jgi:hypothetical protein
MSLNEILADPGLSNWLKDAIKTAYERDPVDALHDVQRLLKMLGERYTQIVNRDRAGLRATPGTSPRSAKIEQPF